ncbi:MAG: hypothetical protein E6J00_13135 [Chloroflexi bacterium]|nr:MAG: hypothetical protein E6J00_13135 [Chloroflexota bacterium]
MSPAELKGGLIAVLGGKDPDRRSATDWAKVIAGDRKTLEQTAATKRWRKPETGFFHLDKLLVTAMTDAGGAGLT